MESYLQSAFDNYLALVNWMRNTTILVIYGQNVTFLGLLICTFTIHILIWVLYELFGLLTDIN